METTQVEVLCLQAPEATVVFAGSPAAAVAPPKSHPKDEKDDQGSVPPQLCQSWVQERCLRGQGGQKPCRGSEKMFE